MGIEIKLFSRINKYERKSSTNMRSFIRLFETLPWFLLISANDQYMAFRVCLMEISCNIYRSHSNLNGSMVYKGNYRVIF